MKRNLRYHTHIKTNSPLKASAGANETQVCQLDSLSKGGAALKCNRETLDALLPNVMSIAPKKPSRLEISFTLSPELEIKGHCEVIYARRVSRDTFLLETQFAGMSEHQLKLIEDFVETQLRQSRSMLQAVA